MEAARIRGERLRGVRRGTRRRLVGRMNRRLSGIRLVGRMNRRLRAVRQGGREQVEERGVPALDPQARIVELRKGDEEIRERDALAAEQLLETAHEVLRDVHVERIARVLRPLRNARNRALARGRRGPSATATPPPRGDGAGDAMSRASNGIRASSRTRESSHSEVMSMGFRGNLGRPSVAALRVARSQPRRRTDALS